MFLTSKLLIHTIPGKEAIQSRSRSASNTISVNIRISDRYNVQINKNRINDRRRRIRINNRIGGIKTLSSISGSIIINYIHTKVVLSFSFCSQL